MSIYTYVDQRAVNTRYIEYIRNNTKTVRLSAYNKKGGGLPPAQMNVDSMKLPACRQAP